MWPWLTVYSMVILFRLPYTSGGTALTALHSSVCAKELWERERDLIVACVWYQPCVCCVCCACGMVWFGLRAWFQMGERACIDKIAFLGVRSVCVSMGARNRMIPWACLREKERGVTRHLQGVTHYTPPGSHKRLRSRSRSQMVGGGWDRSTLSTKDTRINEWCTFSLFLM